MPKITINPERLLADLAKLRTFGARGQGVVRPAFSESDIASRRWLAERMKQAGLNPVFDPVGNLFGLPPEVQDGAGQCLLIGSHSDTQPEGGWLDGAYGVITGLEIARAARETGGPLIACVAFQDEEGRFGTLVGSRIWSGGLSLEEADTLTDTTGVSFSEARRSMSHLCQIDFVSSDLFSGFIEAHIEQGPVLDSHEQSIGVVENIVGIRSQTYCFLGEQNHAGTTPMGQRMDAFQGLVRFTTELNKRFSEIVTKDTVWTIGHVALHPNASSTIPGRVNFSIQWRDADEERLDRMKTILEEVTKELGEVSGLKIESSAYAAILPTKMNADLIDRIEAATQDLVPAGKWRKMPSGALHDAANLSHLMPVAMLFVPSRGGISHDFAEDTAHEHLVLGAQVLAASVT
ncbi:MAG: hydantoinase/carbamoylase family amidase [Sneathiella sp.]